MSRCSPYTKLHLYNHILHKHIHTHTHISIIYIFTKRGREYIDKYMYKHNRQNVYDVHIITFTHVYDPIVRVHVGLPLSFTQFFSLQMYTWVSHFVVVTPNEYTYLYMYTYVYIMMNIKYERLFTHHSIIFLYSFSPWQCITFSL